MPRVKVHDAGLRRRLVDEAGRIVAQEGVAALTLRRLADLAGTSTTAVYSLFGDKEGLLDAMAREGFARLGALLRQAAESPGGPLDRLAAVGLAYRTAALAAPHLYGLQFGQLARGRDAGAAGEAAYAPQLDAVRVCLEAGVVCGDGDAVARHLWAVAHGMVSLELAGLWPDDAGAAYADGLALAVAPFLLPSPGEGR